MGVDAYEELYGGKEWNAALLIYAALIITSCSPHFARNVIFIDNTLQEKHVKTALILCQRMTCHSKTDNNNNIASSSRNKESDLGTIATHDVIMCIGLGRVAMEE